MINPAHPEHLKQINVKPTLQMARVTNSNYRRDIARPANLSGGLRLGLAVLLSFALLALHAFSQQPPRDKQSAIAGDATPSAPPQIAVQILHRSILEAVWGKPMLCEVRQTIVAFDKKRTSFGKYVRGGQGSGRMRLSLQAPVGSRMNSLTQISDGEVLSTLATVGDHSLRTQVDLGKIRDRLTITSQSLHDPVVAMYLAIGGQSELLRKLIQQYNWSQLTEGRWGDEHVWVLRGEAAAEPPLSRSLALIDIRLFENRTGLRPNRAEMIVGYLDSSVPFWLYQVKETYQDDSQDSIKLEVTTEWDSPVVLSNEQLIPELFRLAATEGQSFHETREETKLYLPPSSASIAGSRLRQPKLQ